MEKVLAEIYDLRRYRNNLINEIKQFVPGHFAAHAPSFTHLSDTEIGYLENLDKMRTVATKYAIGKLQTNDTKHIAVIKDYLKMEMLDLSIRNERVALLDEITRAHAMLNNVTTKCYPEARFVYPDTHNSYRPYIDVLKNESI